MSSGIVVVACHAGSEVWRARLPHGWSPERLLAGSAYAPLAAPRVVRDGGGTLVFHYDVRSIEARGPETEARPTRRPAQDAGEPVRPVQRVAAYVVVWSSLGLLATQYSERTGAPGRWGLPGGGVEPGEDPVAAAQRECWEETGQVVAVGQLRDVTSRHWVGRAPSGRLEDFHALGLVYAGSCADPTTPQVHDVGGTTSDAAWVPAAQIEAWPWATHHAGLATVGVPEHAEKD